MAERFTISRLGARGDGIADTVNGPIYIPFTLAGEKVTAVGKGVNRTVDEVEVQSNHRVNPPCRHFGGCGGCQVQHLDDSTYQEWKRSLLNDALKRYGIDAPDFELMTLMGKRRRVVFSVSRTGNELNFGFQQRSTHNIVNISECIVTDGEIVGRLEDIKRLISPLVSGKRPIQVTVLCCENGLDISVETSGNIPDELRKKLTAIFPSTGYCRLVVNGDLIAETSRPYLLLGNVEVTPPAGGFVQAIGEAEEAMANLVCQHLENAKQVADLFCGMGTFVLRLAKHSRVLGIEMDESSLTALDNAWRNTGGSLKEIKLEKRDLFVRPLMSAEMKKIDGVVVDPPRAGAELQMKQIARSRVSRVAMVSCNPTTFARDIEILLRGGFKLRSLTALDQFRFTPHLEVVGLLVR